MTPDSVNSSRLWNSSSESKTSRVCWGDHVSFVICDSSTAIMVPECENDVPEKTICGSHRNANSTCMVSTSVDAKWLMFLTFELHNVDKPENVFNTVSSCSSDTFQEDMVFTPGVTPGGRSCSAMIRQNTEGRKVGEEIDTESFDSQDLLLEGSGLSAEEFAISTQKRIRKPTLRYTDESLNLNSRYFMKGQKFSTSSSMDKFVAVKHLKHPLVRSGTPILSSGESFIEAIQVPFGPEREEECPMKNEIIAVCVAEMEPSPDQSKNKYVRKVISDDDCGQRKHHKFILSEVCENEMEQSPDQPKTAILEDDGGQKKQHKRWTLSEVWTLIEGVSQYGVGRWSEIRKLFFSSTHRTSVDLKDKWRNLLKASCSERKRKKEEDGRQNPWRPLPESVLQRVSELASIYPYPRFGKSKLSETKIPNACHSPTVLLQGQATF